MPKPLILRGSLYLFVLDGGYTFVGRHIDDNRPGRGLFGCFMDDCAPTDIGTFIDKRPSDTWPRLGTIHTIGFNSSKLVFAVQLNEEAWAPFLKALNQAAEAAKEPK